MGWEDRLEEGTETHSSILAWRIPCTEESGWLQSTGSQRGRQDWSDLAASAKVLSLDDKQAGWRLIKIIQDNTHSKQFEHINSLKSHQQFGETGTTVIYIFIDEKEAQAHTTSKCRRQST